MPNTHEKAEFRCSKVATVYQQAVYSGANAKFLQSTLARAGYRGPPKQKCTCSPLQLKMKSHLAILLEI